MGIGQDHYGGCGQIRKYIYFHFPGGEYPSSQKHKRKKNDQHPVIQGVLDNSV